MLQGPQVNSVRHLLQRVKGKGYRQPDTVISISPPPPPNNKKHIPHYRGTMKIMKEHFLMDSAKQCANKCLCKVNKKMIIVHTFHQEQ